MGNGQVLRRAQEIYSDLSTNADRNYTKVCSLVPETPDRYRSHRRFDKFRVNRGATRPVWAVAIAEVNMMMAAATADHEIHLWDLETMELKVSLKGHSDQVWEVKFSTNETTLASASSDKTLRLWDTQDGSPLGVLRGHTAAIRCLSFSYEGYLISGDQDANLFLWEAENAQPIKQWQAHEGCVHSVTFSPADPLMAISVGADGSVASWYVKREEDDVVLGGRFPGGDGGAVLSLTAHPAYPGVVAVGCEDGDVWIWGFKPDFQEGNADVAGHTKLKGHTKAVWFLEFSRDACLLASASADCTVRVWNATNVQSPSLLSVSRAHDSWVRQVRWFTQPGKGLGRKRLLVTCSTDGSVSIWAPPGRLRKINKLQAAPNFGCKDVACEAEVVQLPLVAHEETPQPGSKLPPAPLALPSSETQLQPMPEETATPRDPRDPRDAVPPQAAPPAAAPMPSQTAMPREAAPTPPTPEMTGTAGTGTTKGTAVPVAPPSAVKAPEGATLGPVREGVGSQPKPGPSPPSAGSASRGAALGPVSEGVGSQQKPGPSPPSAASAPRGAALGPVSEGVGSQQKPGPSPPSAGSAPRGVASQPKAGPAPPSAGSAPRGVAIGPVSEGVGFKSASKGSKGSKSLNSTMT